MINGAMSDPNNPRLSVGVLLKKSIGCGHDIFIDLKGSSFNIDCHNFALISHFDLLPNAGFIERLPTLSHFFFAITSLANCHRVDLIATLPIHFTL
jgi:hypothetical protein